MSAFEAQTILSRVDRIRKNLSRKSAASTIFFFFFFFFAAGGSVLSCRCLDPSFPCDVWQNNCGKRFARLIPKELNQRIQWRTLLRFWHWTHRRLCVVFFLGEVEGPLLWCSILWAERGSQPGESARQGTGVPAYGGGYYVVTWSRDGGSAPSADLLVPIQAMIQENADLLHVDRGSAWTWGHLSDSLDHWLEYDFACNKQGRFSAPICWEGKREGGGVFGPINDGTSMGRSAFNRAA